MASIVANPVPIPVLHDSMSNQHFTNAFKKILELYYDRKLCDVTLLCNNREIEIHAHRIILSSVSEYFCGMFTNNLAETFKDQIEIIGDGEALKIIVEFIYTGKIELNDTNVFQILSAANFLQLSIVIKHCCDYLSKNLNIHNCVSINRFSRQQSLKQLNSSSYKYILDHFEKIGANNELLNELSETELLELFDDENLNVIKEEFVFESLLKWINLNKEARFGSIGKLLAKIKLPLLEAAYLTKQIENNKLLSSNSECQSLMLEATLYHINPDKFRSSPIARTQPRKSTQGFLLSIGGIDLSKSSNNYFMEKYDCRTEKWTPVSYSLSTNLPNTLNSTSLSISTSSGQNINPNLIHQANTGVVSNIVKRLQFATAIFGNNLYVVGGREHLKTLNTVECFDLNKQVWTLVSPTMLTHRHGLQATFLNNEPILYAIGGHDGWNFLASVERFDVGNKTWTFVASMNYARSTLGLAVIGNLIYAVGGRDANGCLNTVECFNPLINKWSMCANMHKKRGAVAVTALNGYVYAIGGHDGPTTSANYNRYDCAERYDPKTNQWTMIGSISRPREGIAISTLGSNSIYITGGFDGQKFSSDCERYDPNKNQWIKLTQMNSARAGGCLTYVNINTQSSKQKAEKKNETNDLNANLKQNQALQAPKPSANRFNTITLVDVDELSD